MRTLSAALVWLCSIAAMPVDRCGQDLVGTKFPAVQFDRWVRGAAPTDGKATLYRWWTDTCKYCEASLPAFEQLRKEYEAKGLRVVAVYHPKPPRDVDDAAVAAAATAIGYAGAIALDQDWSILRSFYLGTGERPATSASFLVDSGGVIRFVHPGPMVFPSKDPKHAKENADFTALEQAVQSVLATP